MTSIYFKVTWIFTDDKSNNRPPPRTFKVIISRDLFKTLPTINNGNYSRLYAKFVAAFENAFPEFNDNEYILLNFYGNSLLEPAGRLFLPRLVASSGNSCLDEVGAIPLQILQRSQPKINIITTSTTFGPCGECHGVIKDHLFQCFQCEDYKLCGSCVVAGKHPKHNIIRATVDSKVFDSFF